MADLETLAKALAKGPVPVYLLQGAERLLVDEAAKLVLAAAVDDPNDSMSVTHVDLAETATKVMDVIGAAQSIGLFAGRSAVLVRGVDYVDKASSQRDQLAAYVASPNPQCTVILKASKLNGTSKLVKGVKKLKGYYSFDALKTREVPGWVQGEARRLGHPMDFGTARLIGDLVGGSLQQLRLVVDQLSLFVGPGQPIHGAAVEHCLQSTRAHTVFELVDAVGERRLVPALEHLHAMLSHREAPLRILPMLVRHFRLLWHMVSARDAGQTMDQAAASAGIQGWQAKKLWQQAQRFNAVGVRRAYDRLYETDYRLKSAGLDDGTVMERLVMDLVAG